MIDEKLAKGILGSIAYSQGRNKVSGRPVKPVTLTVQDLIDMFNKQKGLCYWSGLPLDPAFNKIKHHPFAISPERLDNALPYDTSNVVLCRRMFNLGRMAFPEKDFGDVMKVLKEEYQKI
jgi:hypothetical protein